MRHLIGIVLGGMLLWQVGCWVQEDPTLLQPASVDTVLVRILNLAADHQKRSVQIGEYATITNVGYAELSAVYAVPADSLVVSVYKSATEPQWQDSVIFRGGTYVTFVLLQVERQGQPRDTLVPLIALASADGANLTTVGMRLLNAVPDSALYGVAIGCPGSSPDFRFVPYLHLSNFVERSAGNLVLSLLRRFMGKDSLLRFLQLSVQPPLSYTIIAFDNGDGSIQLGVLREQQATDAWTLIPVASALQSVVTVANLTDIAVSVALNGQKLLENLLPWQRSAAVVVPACRRVGQDTLMVVAALDTIKLLVQLEVQQTYVCVLTSQGDSLVPLLYPYPQEDVPGKVAVQIYNATVDRHFLVATGARQLPAGTFVGGEVLAEHLIPNALSTVQYIDQGNVPIAVFDLDRASRFVVGCVVPLEQQAALGILLARNDDLWMVFLPVAEEQVPVHRLPEGRFLRVLNLTSTPVQGSASPVLPDLQIPPGTEIATVVPQTLSAVELDGQPYAFAGTPTDHCIAILAPGEQQPFALAEYYQLPEFSYRPAVRFLHLGSGVPELNISLDSLQGELLFGNMPFGEKTQFLAFPRERRTTFVFWNPETQEVYARLENLFLLRGRIYTVVFYRAPAGYRTFLLQEF